jgi:hypothetical protein
MKDATKEKLLNEIGKLESVQAEIALLSRGASVLPSELNNLVEAQESIVEAMRFIRKAINVH